MNVLFKERLFNWKKLLLFFILFSALFVSFLFTSGLYGLLFKFDVNASDLSGDGEYIKQILILDRLNIHTYMHTVSCMTQIAPLVIFAFSIFSFKRKSLFFTTNI